MKQYIIIYHITSHHIRLKRKKIYITVGRRVTKIFLKKTSDKNGNTFKVRSH